MKRFIISPWILSLFTLGIITSCSDNDPEFNDREVIYISNADLRYDSDGVYSGNMDTGNIIIDDYEFSHYYEDLSGYDYAYGFTASKIDDTSDSHSPLSSFPYASMSGGGVKGPGTPYLVGYWSEYNETDLFTTRTCRIFAEDGEPFKPQSVMVNNTTFGYYGMLYGTPYSKKFGYGDFTTLTAHGVHPDGTESIATFYLANIISDNVASGIIKDWTEFNLSGLGECIGIYFTMASSDTSEYGMNSPAYFCIDRLEVLD